MKFSEQVGRETKNKLEHFEDVAFNPLDPGSILAFSGSVLDTNIMKKRVKKISWNFQDMSGIAQQNIWLDCFTPE